MTKQIGNQNPKKSARNWRKALAAQRAKQAAAEAEAKRTAAKAEPDETGDGEIDDRGLMWWHK
ncbi:MAG: hypothetical protein LBL66_09320 [Clostridiales bacterium]|jgi:hypothetical protein|nr:hypothetical protein [Clostridiales bacterium]